MIPLLYVAQKQMGRQTGSAWVPRVAMDVVADRLSHAADPRLRGRDLLLHVQHEADRRFHLQVCGTTPCWLRGSDEVLRACKDAGALRAMATPARTGCSR